MSVVSLQLSPKAELRIAELADMLGVTPADAVERAVRELHECTFALREENAQPDHMLLLPKQVT